MTQQPANPEPVAATEGNVLELAAAAHLTGLEFGPAGGTGPAKHTYGVVMVGTNLDQLIAQHGAVVGARQVGGVTGTWQKVARLGIDVYAATYGDAWAAQKAIEDHLTRGYRRTPDGALRIDSWRNESAATVTMHPPQYLLVSTWRIASRDL